MIKLNKEELLSLIKDSYEEGWLDRDEELSVSSHFEDHWHDSLTKGVYDAIEGDVYYDKTK